MKGGRSPDTAVAVIAQRDDCIRAGGADDAGRAGRRRPRAAGRHRRGPGGRTRSVRGGCRRPGPAGRPHRGGHAHGCSCPRAWWTRSNGAGATALELPLTRQVDPADGGAALQAAAVAVPAGEYDWVVLTSITAVERFMGVLRDARALGSTLVAAVGPATADALRRTGVEPDLIPAEHSAQGLVAAFPDPDDGSRRVLFPSADLAFADRSRRARPARAGRCTAWRRIAPWRAPHPSRRCWTGWLPPMR